MKKNSVKKKVFYQVFKIVMLVILMVPLLYWDQWLVPFLKNYFSDKSVNLAFKGLSIIDWLLAGRIIERMIHIFFWEAAVAPKLDGKTPKLLENVLAFIVYFLVIIAILNLVFKLPVSGIWATSGVIGLVIGFALRSTLTDIFSGIAINIDRPFKVDDFIMVEIRGAQPFDGRVTEITWRSTRIERSEGAVSVVPNSLLDTALVTNLSRPGKISRFDLQFVMDFEISPDRVLRILEAAVKSSKGPLEDPGPSVKISKVTEIGVIYRVYYWLDPSEVSPKKGRHEVAKNILLHLHQAGLSLARIKQDIFYDRMPVRSLDISSDFTEILKRIEIFQLFDEKELVKLSKKLSRVKLKAGTTVVHEDEPGESMFIILEGLLAVYKEKKGKGPAKIDQLIPGQFFGEMSLLTGEPRSATIECVTDSVIFEIKKSDITAYLRARPKVAEEITKVIAARKTVLADEDKRYTDKRKGAEKGHLADQILHKMIHFFGFHLMKKK